MGNEIERLFDDPTTSDDLRRVLDAAATHEPAKADLARLGAKLAAALPPGALPAPNVPPASAAAASGGSVAVKIAAGLVVLAVGGGGAWLATSREPSTASVSTAPIPSALTTIPPTEPSSAVPSITVDALPSTSTAPPTRARATSAPSAAVPPEATLLARAHAELLRGGAAEALATAGEHARAYPHGSLAQEREVIAIEALVALGRRAEARTRADAFRLDYPGSSHAARIGRLVEEP